jgi:hypothetical protein
MKKFKLFFYLFLSSIDSFSQSFIYTSRAIEDSWGIMDVVETDNGYLFSERESNLANDSILIKLVHLSFKGEVKNIELINFAKVLTASYFIKSKDSLYLTFIERTPESFPNIFYELNINSRSIRKFELSLTDKAAYCQTFLINDSTYIVATGGNGRDPKLVFINRNNSTLQYFEIPNIPMDIEFNYDSTQFLIKGLSSIAQINKQNGNVIIKKDKLDYGELAGNIIYLNKKSYYINTGGQQQNFGYRVGRDTIDLAVSILNKDLILQKNLTIGRRGDTIDCPAIIESICGTNGGFFIGGTSNFRMWEYPFGYEPSWFTISKIDSNANLQWTKEYGGDAYYIMYGIIATSDGGGIAYGTIQDTTDRNFNRDPFLVKFDRDGLILFSHNFSSNSQKPIEIYPNPTKNYFHIKTIDDLSIFRIEILNESGKKVKSIGADSILSEVFIGGLSNGIYFINFYNNQNEFLACEKIVVIK